MELNLFDTTNKYYPEIIEKEMNLSANETSKNMNLLYMIFQNISPTSPTFCGIWKGIL